MPLDFARKFSNTRVIMDATELPIQKPSDVNAQCITGSSYKHKGAVSCISKAFGGSASDRQIIEKSDLLNPSLNMFEKGDSIMAEKEDNGTGRVCKYPHNASRKISTRTRGSSAR